MSLINEFGSLYLASRLERLSEILKKDAVRLFKSHLPDIKYKWYPVLYALDKKKSISVVELAVELSYAHPTIIDVLREMEENKLIKSITDKTDNRKRLLSLTAKGSQMQKRIVPITRIFTKVVNELIDNNNHLLMAIEEVEERLEDEPFFNTVNKLMKAEPTMI